MSIDAMDTIIKLLQDHDSFLLVPHDRADGDACGSMLALAEALKRAGKQADTLLLGPLSPRYERVTADQKLTVLGGDISLDQLPTVEVVIVIDTSSTRQLAPIMPWLKRFTGTIAVIDHHAGGDFACDVKLIDETRAATGLLVAMILERMGWLDSSTIATYLLVAIATDTGWFSYNNVSAECFAWAAKLGELGAPLCDIHKKLFLADPPERFRLLTKAMCSAELLFDGRIVVFTLTRADFQATGASQAHTENIIDHACRLDCMRAAALFVEQPDGTIRISLRSRESVDVHLLAHRMGGGGHRQAAGMKLTGPLDQIKSRVLTELIDTLKQCQQ